MTQYLDSSALIKRYLDETGSGDARLLLLDDPDWVTAQHTFTETYRALSLLARDGDVPRAVDLLEADWPRIAKVQLDEPVCRRAAVLAVMTGTRTLDALHLAAAERAGGRAIAFHTYDLRQANAARTLGYPVRGGP